MSGNDGLESVGAAPLVWRGVHDDSVSGTSVQKSGSVYRPGTEVVWAGRYGIPSVDIIDRIVDSYRYANIPLETFVSDSQYMDGDQDFTLSASYPLPAMKVAPIILPSALSTTTLIPLLIWEFQATRQKLHPSLKAFIALRSCPSAAKAFPCVMPLLYPSPPHGGAY